MKDYENGGKKEMGILAIHSKEVRKDLGGLAYYGMFALQHRGQQSAGFTICDTITENKVRHRTIKKPGLVADVFSLEDLNSYIGNILIGHVRYGREGYSSMRNCQPLEGETSLGKVSIVHNGDLSNYKELKQELLGEGDLFQTSIDTEVILKLIGKNAVHGVKECTLNTVNKLKGGFALAMILNDKLVGVRDPRGLRPLSLGKIGEETLVLASETCALDAMGAEFIREIEPGEIVIIDEKGIESIKYNDKEKKQVSAFEYIYFARPDSVIDGIDVYGFRHETGKYLYRQNPIEADIVIGVPDSGVPAAIGYAQESGIPYRPALVKNKYIGRTFITPIQELREQAVKVKLNPIKSLLEGKRVVVVDDSIVRGTTSKKLVKMLYEAGAKEVHFRAASPIVIKEDFFGVDVNPEAHLIGNYLTLDEIRDKIGATTLGYLSYENLRKIFGRDDFYMDCFKKDEK